MVSLTEVTEVDIMSLPVELQVQILRFTWRNMSDVLMQQQVNTFLRSIIIEHFWGSLRKLEITGSQDENDMLQILNNYEIRSSALPQLLRFILKNASKITELTLAWPMSRVENWMEIRKQHASAIIDAVVEHKELKLKAIVLDGHFLMTDRAPVLLHAHSQHLRKVVCNSGCVCESCCFCPNIETTALYSSLQEASQLTSFHTNIGIGATDNDVAVLNEVQLFAKNKRITELSFPAGSRTNCDALTEILLPAFRENLQAVTIYNTCTYRLNLFTNVGAPVVPHVKQLTVFNCCADAACGFDRHFVHLFPNTESLRIVKQARFPAQQLAQLIREFMEQFYDKNQSVEIYCLSKVRFGNDEAVDSWAKEVSKSVRCSKQILDASGNIVPKFLLGSSSVIFRKGNVTVRVW